MIPSYLERFANGVFPDASHLVVVVVGVVAVIVVAVASLATGTIVCNWSLHRTVL
jgi:hypothetical protein